MDAARSLALVGHPGHGSLADIAAEILSVGHVGLLTAGILIWAETTRPLRIGLAGAAAAALWAGAGPVGGLPERSEEHTSELQSLMRDSSAGFCLKKKKT